MELDRKTLFAKCIHEDNIDALRGGLFAWMQLCLSSSDPIDFVNEFIAYAPDEAVVAIVLSTMKKLDGSAMKSDMKTWEGQIQAWKDFTKENEPRIIHG